MHIISTILGMWVQHIIFSLFMAPPVLFLGRRRAHWEERDLLALVVPFSVWLVLMLTPWSDGKTLGNALVEGGLD
jgi:hypothetical protein